MDLQEACNQMFELGTWEQNKGREQTRYFAELALRHLPTPVKNALQEGASLLDYASALGEGTAAFKTAFPHCRPSGYEWAEAGCRKAREFYPHLEFTSERPTLPFDIVYCSNLLEHIEDFQGEMIRQMELASRFYIALVPWEEGIPLCPSHVHSFNSKIFPPPIPGWTCILSRSFFTSSYWTGQQLLAVYGRYPIMKTDD